MNGRKEPSSAKNATEERRARNGELGVVASLQHHPAARRAAGLATKILRGDGVCPHRPRSRAATRAQIGPVWCELHELQHTGTTPVANGCGPPGPDRARAPPTARCRTSQTGRTLAPHASARPATQRRHPPPPPAAATRRRGPPHRPLSTRREDERSPPHHALRLRRPGAATTAGAGGGSGRSSSGSRFSGWGKGCPPEPPA